MFRKRFTTIVVFVFCLALITPVSAKTVHLKLIETTDVHGSFFPYDFIKAKDVPASLAQTYTYIKEQRANPDQHVLLIDNGDILQGQPTVYYSNFEKTDSPHICSQIMNFMKYDVGVFGNHDVEAGHPIYDKLAKEFTFPWLAANAVKTGTDDPYFDAYAVFETDGVKVAILGLTTPGVPNWLPENLWEGIEYRDMVESAKKWVAIIQEKEHPDLLVGSFHSGVDFTYKGQTADTPLNENATEIVAQKVPGFDVVFSGHDHKIWNKVITNEAGGDVLVIGANNAAKSAAVADVTLTFDEQAKGWKKEIRGEIIDIKEYAADEEFLTQFAGIVNEVKAYVDKPIGKFTKTISTREAMFGDSPFVDLIHHIQLELTQADVSFAAPLSFDTSIEEGEVFVRDMFKLYKYENLLYTMKLSGQEIKDFLEYSYGNWFDQMKDADSHLILFKKDDNGELIWSERSGSYETVARYYNYDSAAGINYTVDVSKPVGERITITDLFDGTAFDLKKIYKVAINSYRGNGGGGHLTKGAGIPKAELTDRMLSSTIKDLRYFLMKWIEGQQVVTPKAYGNWHMIPADWWEKAKAKDYTVLYESEAPKK